MKIKKDNSMIRKDRDREEVPSHPQQPLRRSPLAKKLLIKGENLRQFEEMRVKVIAETCPQTEIEMILCEKIISATWKLRRAMELERNLLNRQNTFSQNEREQNEIFGSGKNRRIRNLKKVSISNPDIQQVIQYQMSLEKGLQKTIERLREEQVLRDAPNPIIKTKNA